ncbi:MAG: hypothetical protein JO354_02165 [Verrucomicrobia bacterium]|nr:hypothetical protein [Verrucomicrobiota bacterium]
MTDAPECLPRRDKPLTLPDGSGRPARFRAAVGAEPGAGSIILPRLRLTRPPMTQNIVVPRLRTAIA